MPYITAAVELDEFDTDDLIEEIEHRGYKVVDEDEQVVGLDNEDVKWLKWFIIDNADLLKDIQARNFYYKLRGIK